MDPWRTVWLQMCVTNARNMLRFLMFTAATLPLFPSVVILRQYWKVSMIADLWWNASCAIGKMKSKSCHLCWPATENLSPWSSGGISNVHIPAPSELQLSCLSTKNLLLITGKSVMGDWTPGVQAQSMFRAVTPRKSYSGGQRLMGSCGSEMGGWVNWLCAARTEKGCAARRREVTSNYCQEFTADVQKEVLDADVVLKFTFLKLFGIFASNQTVWNNSDK